MLSIDFIVELPESSACDAVMTVVDLVLKRAHFILIHITVTTKGIAWLFLYHI